MVSMSCGAQERRRENRDAHIGGDDGQTKGNRFYVIVRVHSHEFTISLHIQNPRVARETKCDFSWKCSDGDDISFCTHYISISTLPMQITPGS